MCISPAPRRGEISGPILPVPLERIVEQNVDFPVLHRGEIVGPILPVPLECIVEQNVDFPAPRRGEISGDFQPVPLGRMQEQVVEQIADFSVCLVLETVRIRLRIPLCL